MHVGREMVRGKGRTVMKVMVMVGRRMGREVPISWWWPVVVIKDMDWVRIGVEGRLRRRRRTKVVH